MDWLFMFVILLILGIIINKYVIYIYDCDKNDLFWELNIIDCWLELLKVGI